LQTKPKATMSESAVLKITGMKNPGMLEEMQATWVELISEMFPKEEKTGLDDLIAINSQQKMKGFLLGISSQILCLNPTNLDSFMTKGGDYWSSSPCVQHDMQLEVMKCLLAFRKRQHLEMLDFTEIRRIIDNRKLKFIFSKEYFVNFTVQENAANHLLYLQGLYVKCFIYFRLRHDMRFRASIDSFMIELDNPFTRHAIRQENSTDQYFSKKYLSAEFNIQLFCISLLERFFPNISGIWAQSGHMTPAYILQFIRLTFEYGFIDGQNAKVILKLLVKAANSLSKMEEAYSERYVYTEKSFTQKMRLSDVVNMFTKCREHLAMILVEIYTLLNDNFFVERFPKYCAIHRCDKQESLKEIEVAITEDVKEFFILFDKETNDAFLSITLSYLNRHFELCGMSTSSEFCKSAVEKIFMTLTTTQKDVFLNSLKQITVRDLTFMDDKLKKSNSAWEFAENYGYALRKLMDFISRGFFHQDTGKYSAPNSNIAVDELYDKYLSKYLSAPNKVRISESNTALDKPDNRNLQGALKRIVQDIRELINSRPESKVSLVKESIPLMLVTLPDYCVDYFHEDVYKIIADECFTVLGEITIGNNFAKAQIFKGESLFHFRKLLQKFDRDAFGFLFKLCSEPNASIFMGRDVFATFLRLYMRLDNSVFERLKPERHEKDKDLMVVQHLEKCISILLLVRFFAKLFDKAFLDETEKLQNILLTQETIFDAFHEYFIVKLMEYIELYGYQDVAKEHAPADCRLKLELFADGKEEELLISLSAITSNATETELIMLKVQMGFEFLKLYNRLTTDCISRVHQKKLDELFKHRSLPDFVTGQGLIRNYWLFPESIEAEFIDLARIVCVFPEQNTMIEKIVDFDTGIMEIANTAAKKELNNKIMMVANGNSFLGQDPPNIEDLKLQIKQLAFRELESISKFMMSIESLKSHAYPGKKPEIYIFKGVLPLLYAYLTTLRNQSLLTNSKQIRIAFSRVTTILNMLLYSKDSIEKFCGKTMALSAEIIQKLGYTPSLIKGFEIPWMRARNSEGLIPNILKDIQVNEDASTAMMNLVKGKEAGTTDDSQDVTKMEAVYWSTSHYLVEQIEKYFEGTDYNNIIELKKDISKDRMEELMYAAKFEELTNDPELLLKQQVLNLYIKEFQKAKDDYLNREEEPNLLKFFERDTQILQGVFMSCKQRLVGHSKLETRGRSVQLCDSKETAKFWVNGSSIGLVTLIGMLIERSTVARGELYDFICQGNEEAEGLEDRSENGDDKVDDLPEHAELNSMQSEAFHQSFKDKTKTEQDEVILSTLIRIQTDLVFYLNSCSQRNMVWWVVHRVYEMISLFFKNLCECNFMQFKEFLGKNVPSIRDSEWKSDYRNYNYTKIFSEQMKYLLKTTQISINQEPYLIPSDYPDRVQDVFMPLAKIVNEVVIGPCDINQNIIIDTDLTGICSLATRIMDDTESKFYDISNICLELILTLTEGFKDSILKKIASKLPPSIIKDRISRLIKKLYVQHQIREGDFRFVEVKEDEAPQNVAKNQVLPVRKIKMPTTIREAIEKRNDQIVTEKMEKVPRITDWQDLFDLYMAEKKFSDSPLFEFSFKLLVLWFTLAKCSKSHNNQLEDIKRTSSEFFKEDSFSKGLGKGLKFFGVNKLVEGATGQLMKLISDVPKPSDLDAIFHFLTKSIMCSIEVIDQRGEGVILTFPKKPECFMLSDEAKKNYRKECDISDSNTKMGDLLRNFDLFVIQMESSFRTSKMLGRFYTLISTDAFWYYTLGCYAIAFVLNVILAVSSVREKDESGAYVGQFIYSSTGAESAINVLSILLIIISGLMLFMWFVTKYVSTYETRREDYKFDHPGKNPNSLKAILYIGIVESFLKQNFAVSYTLHLVFTLLGYFSLDVFYSFNLLCIINISNTTKFVLKSIMLHIDQLALTFMLAMFVIYIYTIMVMTYFHDSLKFDTGSTNQICDEMYLCYIYVLNLGFRNGGGFAESMNDVSTQDRFAARTFFDLSFFMLINVISLNVIFGIIIDTFSQLRDEENGRGSYSF
jgi:Ion transport protein